MNIIEKIKSLFKRSKVKGLLEPQMQYNTNSQRKSFLKGLQNYKSKTQKNEYLEYELNEYFKNYKELVNAGDLENCSYKALTRINAMQDSMEPNRQKETNLLNNINYSSRYYFQVQGKNTPYFYHIKSAGYQIPDYKDMVKIYVNCKNENIAEIAENLLNNNQNPNMYLKINATDSPNGQKRSEKIVIYTTDREFNYNIQLLEQLRQQRPDLFEGSYKNNPFLPNINGFAYAKYPTSNVYHNLDGSSKKFSQSTNDLISETINQSFMNVARQIAHNDEKLRFLLHPNNYNNEVLYSMQYDYIKNYYNDYLLESMENNMKYLCQANNLYIHGIDNDNDIYNRDNNKNYRNNMDDYQR